MFRKALTIAEMLVLPALIGVKNKSVKAVKPSKSLVKLSYTCSIFGLREIL